MACLYLCPMQLSLSASGLVASPPSTLQWRRLIRWRPVSEMVTLAAGIEEKRGMAAKKDADPKSKPAVSTLEPVKLQNLPAWAWIVGAVLVIGIIFTGYRTVQ